MKSPAFQFYAAEWISDEHVSMMSLEEEGAYIRLLAYCWREGSISSDLNALSKLCKGASTTLLALVVKRFKPNPTDTARLIHSRLEKEREKQAAWREKSAKGGRKSAKTRKAKRRVSKRLETEVKGGSTKVEAAPLNQKPTLQSSSSSASLSTSTKEKKEKELRPAKARDERTDHPAIQAFYKVRGSYPLKAMWDFVIEALGDEPDVPRMRECWKAWGGHGYNPQDLVWVLDWYGNGIPEHKKIGARNGTGKQHHETAADRRAQTFSNQLAVVAELRSEGSGDSDEDASGGRIAASR